MSDLNFKTLLLMYIFVFTLAIMFNSRLAKRFLSISSCVLTYVFLDFANFEAILALTISLNLMGVLYEMLLVNLPVKRKSRRNEANQKNIP